MGRTTVFWLGGLMLLASVWCSTAEPRTGPELNDVVLCDALDSAQAPRVLPEPVSGEARRICICGYLQTDDDITLQVLWSRERESVLRDRAAFRRGPLISCIESDTGFEAGRYVVAVVDYKSEIARLDFSVAAAE